MNVQPLATFDAALCIEAPPRHEEVTEIQDVDTGELICYANPDRAQWLCNVIMAKPNFYLAEAPGKYDCQQLQQALLTHEEWWTLFKPRWYQGEIAEAECQRNGTSTGLLYGGDRSLGDKREAQANRLAAMTALEVSQFIVSHRVSISDALYRGFPVSAIAVDAYNAHDPRSAIKLPHGYTRVGDFYQKQ